MTSNKWEAQVKDNNDPLQAGRVKIKIPTLHANVTDDLLPWAKQDTLSTGGSKTYGKSSIPEINSLVWVSFENEKDFLKPYYTSDIHLNNFHPHSLFEDNIKSEITGFTSSYPDIKYTYYKNGVCIGVSSNTTNPEIFIYHPTGAYSFIDKNGKMWNNSPAGIDNKSGSATSEPTLLGTQLKTTLETLIDTINLITVACPSGGGTSGPPNNAAAFTVIKTNLTTILSQLNTNN